LNNEYLNIHCPLESTISKPLSAIDDISEQPIASSSKVKLEDLSILKNSKIGKVEPSPEVTENKAESTNTNKSIFGSLLDQIRSRRNDKDVIDENVKETITENVNESQPTYKIEPNVSVDSNDSLDRYFPEKSPEIVITETQENIINTQNEQAGIIKERLEEIASEIIHPKNKSLFSNLFDQINSLRKSPKLESKSTIETPVNTEDTQQDNIITEEVDQTKDTSLFTNLFKDIKSQRKEYGTPILESKTLVSSDNIVNDNSIVNRTPIEQYPDALNLFDDTNALFDSMEEENNNIFTENTDIKGKLLNLFMNKMILILLALMK